MAIRETLNLLPHCGFARAFLPRVANGDRPAQWLAAKSNKRKINGGKIG
jgi:hypothetical protein